MRAIVLAIIFHAFSGAVALAQSDVKKKSDGGILFLLEEEKESADGTDTESGRSELTPKLELSALAGPVSTTYRMESASGHNVRLAGTIGYRLGLMAAYQASGTLTLELQLSRKRTEFAPLSGITSMPLEVKEQQVDLASRHSIGEGFYIRPSYRFQYREAREVSPVAVVTSAVTHGLGIGLGVQVIAAGKWKVDIWAGAYVPVYYLEKFQRTGGSTFRGGIEAQNRFQYMLGPKFGVGLAPKFSLLFHSYSGTGERSVRDASERWLELALPVELGLLF